VGSKLSADYLTVLPGPVCFNTSASAEGQAMLYHEGAYYLFGSHLSGLATNPGKKERGGEMERHWQPASGGPHEGRNDDTERHVARSSRAARLFRCNATVLSDCCTEPGAPTKWEDLGNPAVGPGKTPEGQGPDHTFNSQSTFVPSPLHNYVDRNPGLTELFENWSSVWSSVFSVARNRVEEQVLPLDSHSSSPSPEQPGAGAGAQALALWMGDRWNPDKKLVPGGEHNATYVWLNLVATSGGGTPPITMQWETNIVPGQ
jgi:hypothetical protein